jgi:uncharacterized protein (DUF2141 family)
MSLKAFQPTAGRLLGPACALAAAAASPAYAEHQLCNGEPTSINVIVEGLRSTRGDVVVEIYPDDAKNFLASHTQVNSIHLKIDSNPQPVCLPIPKPGFYGVAVFHDENGDREFNRNFLGIPTEGFGLSNNPPVRFSKPSFETVRFQAGEGQTTIHVRMHYVLGGKGSN